MDILIKSFNRAYLLNRCLYSIAKHLKNFTGKIYILDDGTPAVYLDKILLKYPQVIIIKSDNYELKSKLIESQNKHLPNIIPSKLWHDSALNISEYFILLEDDIWFTKNIDATILQASCEKENIALLKLFWVGNTQVIGQNPIKMDSNIVLYKPVIPYESPTLYKYVFSKHNPLWRKLLTSINLYSEKKKLQYYTIYAVAGAVFKKDYYLSIWNNADSIVHEQQQLINAIKYYNKNVVSYGRTFSEVLKTSFVSSAFQKQEYSIFSIHNFNFTLNEFWLKNEDVFCNNLVEDLNQNDIIDILRHSNKSDLYINQWKDWANNFKKGYQDIGCDM